MCCNKYIASIEISIVSQLGHFPFRTIAFKFNNTLYIVCVVQINLNKVAGNLQTRAKCRVRSNEKDPKVYQYSQYTSL